MFEWLLEGEADSMAVDADSAKPEADNEKQQQQQLKLQKANKSGEKTITTVPELIRYMRATTKGTNRVHQLLLERIFHFNCFYLHESSDKMTPIEFKLTFINSRRLERFGFVAEPEDSPEVLWDKVRSRPTSTHRRLQFLNSSLLLEIQAPSDRS